MAKGGTYERFLAVQLSEWWSEGKRDDLVWRTSGSGARATVRGRKGKQTAGHTGDLGATCEDASPLFKLIAFEAKRGKQANATIQDLIDRGPAQKLPTGYELFIGQAIVASKNAKTPYWAVIHRRDKHVSLIYFPTELYLSLLRIAGRPLRIRPFLSFQARVRISVLDDAGKRIKGKLRTEKVNACGTTLDSFCENIEPRWLKKLAKTF